jgi:hypothetical protein
MRRFALCLCVASTLMAGSVTNDQIIQMIKSGTSEKAIQERIKKEGLAFSPTGETQMAIRNAGGSLDLTCFIYMTAGGKGVASSSSGSNPEQKPRKLDGSDPWDGEVGIFIDQNFGQSQSVPVAMLGLGSGTISSKAINPLGGGVRLAFNVADFGAVCLGISGLCAESRG